MAESVFCRHVVRGYGRFEAYINHTGEDATQGAAGIKEQKTEEGKERDKRKPV